MLDARGNLNGHTHGPNFGRKVEDCERCDELAEGAAPKAAPGWVSRSRQRRADEAALSRAIERHDCVKSNCGSVCTAFDW